MKRFLSILLSSVIICFTCIMDTFSVTAASAQTKIEVKKGEIAVLNVNIPERISVKVGSINFEYDSEFELISGDWSLQNTTLKRFSANTKKGIFTFSSDRSVSGTVFVINLKSADNIAFGSHTIAYSISLRNSEGVSYNYNGTFIINVVGSQVLGDVDGNGVITIIDATTIQKALAGLSVQHYNKAAADTTGDGKITNQDVLAIQKYLVRLSTNGKIGKQLK